MTPERTADLIAGTFAKDEEEKRLIKNAINRAILAEREAQRERDAKIAGYFAANSVVAQSIEAYIRKGEA